MTTLKELLLRQPPWTLAVAESITSGHLQAAVGAISGASAFFLGGLTAYSLEQKVRHLGVDPKVAEPVNSVSSEVAEQMARGVCRMFGSTLGAATTGYAEPSPANEVVHPFACWAIYHAGQDCGAAHSGRSGRVTFPAPSSRIEVQEGVAAVVLNELLAYLKEVREFNATNSPTR